MSVALLLVGVALLVAGVLVVSAATPILVAIGLWAAVAGWRAATARLVADDAGVVVHNHWRTHRLSLTDVDEVSADTRTNRLGRVPYSSPWNPPHRFTCGAISLRDGRTITPDALVSLPSNALDGLEVAAAVKTAALNRWVRLWLRSGS